MFVLPNLLPSKLYSAFPEGVEVERVGLKKAITTTQAFLHDAAPATLAEVE